MKNLLKLGIVITKIEQMQIHGGGLGFCCEWCPDGSCNGWVGDPRTPCPFAASCS